jgi:hypothetical protein
MKPRKPKKLAYELIEKASAIGTPMYLLLAELVREHHTDLRDARIALAWALSWKPDVDGKVTLGKCKKASDLDRELAAFDFVILLSKAFWSDLRVSDLQRRALLDHELHHATVKYDENGEPVVDERMRIVYRVRKHDIEEFTDIVRRYGCYKADLEQFAAALTRAGVPKYEPCDQCHESPGWVAMVDEKGVNRVARCVCYTQWAEQRELLSANA